MDAESDEDELVIERQDAADQDNSDGPGDQPEEPPEPDMRKKANDHIDVKA